MPLRERKKKVLLVVSAFERTPNSEGRSKRGNSPKGAPSRLADAGKKEESFVGRRMFLRIPNWKDESWEEATKPQKGAKESGKWLEVDH